MMKRVILMLYLLAFIAVSCKQTKPVSTLEGRYINSNEAGCDLVLDITKQDEGYSYKFETPDTLYAGMVSIEKDEFGDGGYITLKEFKWYKYIGQLYADDNADEMEGINTYGLDLFWSDNTLSFQNYGNAMNYYVKLKECGEKFVTLAKDTIAVR